MDIGRVGTNLRIETVSHVFLSCIFVANSTKKIYIKSILVGKIQGAKDNLTKMQCIIKVHSTGFQKRYSIILKLREFLIVHMDWKSSDGI